MPSDGYVIPFADSPLDQNNVTNTPYMQLIQYAKSGIIITTPYFIIDQEVANCTYSSSNLWYQN